MPGYEKLPQTGGVFLFAKAQVREVPYPCMAVSAFLFLALFFSALLVLVLLSGLVGFLRTGVPLVRTRARELGEVVSGLGPRPAGPVFDLGSGDGTAALVLERVTGSEVEGFELVGWAHRWSRIRRRALGSRVRFSRVDFFKIPWGRASLLYAYLYPAVMRRVEEKFLADCRRGTQLLVRDFPLPTLRAVRRWRFGPNVAGAARALTAKDRARLLVTHLFSNPPVSHEYFLYAHP